MTNQLVSPLGILLLERGALPVGVAPAPLVGGLRHPSTFDFPVITETVAGAWADNVMRGDSTVEPAYVAAARKLVDRGVRAIISNCGSAIQYQDAVSAAVDVPVGMSSLVLLPLLLRVLPQSSAIGIVTANLAQCEGELGLDNERDRGRIAISSIEGGRMWRNEIKRPPPPTSAADMELDILECVERLQAARPNLTAILIQCAGLAFASQKVRYKTNLPVYDITTLARLLHASAA